MDDKLYNELRTLNEEGKSQDEILYFIFSKGLFITDAIIAVRALYGIKLDEAKKIVSLSRHWINTHERNQNLHDALGKTSEIFEKSMNLKSENMNSINVIAPYKYLDMWVFDDARVGLVQEPFVGGADVMIDRIVENITNIDDGFIMLFSDAPFPGHSIKLEWRRADGSGNWYYSDKLDMEGWLCPALFRYFTETPKEIFVQVKSKT